MFQFLKCLYQTKVPSLLWRKFNSKYSTLLTNIQMLKDVTHTESNAIVWFPEISGYVNWRCGFLCQMKHIITINCLTYKKICNNRQNNSPFRNKSQNDNMPKSIEMFQWTYLNHMRENKIIEVTTNPSQ